MSPGSIDRSSLHNSLVDHHILHVYRTVEYHTLIDPGGGCRLIPLRPPWLVPPVMVNASLEAVN